MIFGNEYDLSLWYMLKVRNRYRKKTINFVKELPEELLENIRTTYLKGIKNNSGVGDDKDEFYNVRSKVDSDTYYKFYIMCRDLYIIKTQVVAGARRQVYSLCLSPLSPDEIMHLKNSKERQLGSVGIGHYPKISYIEVDYSLKRRKSGYWITHTYAILGNLIEIRFGRPVSIKNMPEEMFRSDPKPNNLPKSE